MYDLRFVGMSAVLAILMPYTGFGVVERARASPVLVRRSWILAGGAAVGIGFCGVLDCGTWALSLPVPVRYHYPTLLLSVLLGILCGVAGVFAATREYKGILQAFVASWIVGSSATAISYLCLKSWRMPAVVEYRWGLVLVSPALGVLAFLLALVFLFGPLHTKTRGFFRSAMASVVVGIAVMALPYAALRAVRFHPADVEVASADTFARSFANLALLAGIAFFVLSAMVLITTLHRVLSSQEEMFERARERESFFNNLAEAIPGIVWIANATGQTSYINKHWYEMTGTDPAEQVGDGWMNSIHPDDRQVLSEKWKSCLRSGETFEIEYRLHDAVRGYRWYLDRAVPLRDDKGAILQWFGTCTDIEEQKLYQQTLEKQIKERTEELAGANTQLQQEMWEKDLARRTLDEQNEKMLKTLEERSRRATLLAKMGELLQSCIAREEVFTAALGFAPKIFPSRRGAISLFTAAHNLLEVAGQWNDCELPVASFETEACWALRTAHPHMVQAGDTTARCLHAAGVGNTYLCVPILAQGEALGILHIQATDADPEMTEAEMSFHTTFAAQVGLSVANIRLREALRTQSIKDPLTGLYNRRFLQEVLEREIRRAIRSEQHLGVLILDLDYFKKFNDTYGHEAGDAVLRETAAFLVQSVRAEDFVCRYGGEEFVVVLPTADLRASEARAQRIREKLRNLVVMDHGRSLGVITASIGVAALPNQGTSEKELLQAADAALYRAKREGRDRVVVADMPAAEAAHGA
jgi:diguanylate cyclase (GGDEF)-like protein/PAS domain S-box-containing protein